MAGAGWGCRGGAGSRGHEPHLLGSDGLSRHRGSRGLHVVWAAVPEVVDLL